ncbi:MULTISPECIES: glycosyltransferase family 2 protein [unclassified Bradyrhizobium]|uniref:glycosyltransferase family 2 protein n=1 Tax=unclassified Bradyrhizobium TaxID=2631580 RepID=UPI002478BFDB|nr:MULTISPECIES: glycosyltransferase family 2 protein [unclassified Bradyrhizobium]WGS18262.1 glycosyltransferase [Bradyrhizobium sp. ISRA463]WGS25079.1 glycosyltransferase [Bradyrhizobium sp. ISRA464]
MSTSTCLVSVVIPAFNAEATIDETLCSVRSQSHERLEIIVVDDGSTDDTVAVAERHADRDPRITIIRQDNAGVAAARNAGWQAARAEFIAFIDADDLWAPGKIERQLQAMIDGGEKTGLVYSWYAWIDAKSRVSVKSDPVFHAGDVLDYLFESNFIGNGSSAMVRREALIAARGFESGLRASGAQGCEDLLFYCRVAESYHFAVVPEYEIGYRYLPNNMSSDMTRMFRSWMLVADEMAARHPDRIALLDRGISNYARWLLRRALTGGRVGYFAPVFMLLFGRNPALAVKVAVLDLPRDIVSAVWWTVRSLRHRKLRRPSPSFLIGDPSQSRWQKTQTI